MRIGLSLVGLLFSAQAMASGDAHVTNFFSTFSDSHAPDLGWMLVTFSVFAFVLYKFGILKLKAYVADRHVEIKDAIEKAQKAKAEADAARAAFEERLRGLDQEITKLKADFKQQGEKEKARLEASGKAAAERIRNDAEETITQERNALELELKNDLIRRAFKSARAQIQSELSDSDHQRLEQDFVGEIGQSQQGAQ